ncbi:MAG TPA: hypothetical protein DCZ93_00855 [Elusimicrobia bacterium]|nr:hypothetical protein [Elusimicrobiota bacterium]
MKNMLKTKIFGAILSAAVLTGTCAAEDKALAGGEKTKVPAEVSEISIEAGNMVSITVLKTADTIGYAELRSKSGAGDQVSVELHGTKMLIKVAGSEEVSKPEAGGKYNSLKLYIPEGRNITILGRNLVVSGEIAAKNLTVKAISVSMHALKISASEAVSVEAGTAQLKFALSSAKKLTVKVDRVSGKITIPASARLDCPEKEGLQVVRAGGVKSLAVKKS